VESFDQDSKTCFFGDGLAACYERLGVQVPELTERIKQTIAVG
jgi:hypothetical protein